MITATISTLALAMTSGAPLWIAGWIIVLGLAIGLAAYYTRQRRRRRSHHRPQ